MFGGAGRLCEALWFAAVGGQRPQRPAEGSGPLPTMQRIRGGNGKVEGRACPAPTDCRKRFVDERGKGGRQPSPDGAGGAEPRPYAHPIPTAGVRGRLAAHNERRQFASQTRSCGCLPPQFRFAQLWPLTHNPAPHRNSGSFLCKLSFAAKRKRVSGRLPLIL